ncbi:hypothetical protein ABZ721_14615 [Streptomyces sp. NPDC006733]
MLAEAATVTVTNTVAYDRQAIEGRVVERLSHDSGSRRFSGQHQEPHL